MFRPPATGYVDRVTDPANGPDAPAPPRTARSASDARRRQPDTRRPGGPRHHAASRRRTPTGDEPEDASPSPEPTADGEIHARTQTEQANEELQEENAETALDQPSDGSGGE